MIGWLKERFSHLEAVSDKILTGQFKNGNRDAFGILYMKYLPAIYRYIYFRVNQNRQEAEDLAEAVFFKAWENLKIMKEENLNFRAWIYRVAHNSVIDHYRKGNRLVALDESVSTGQSVEEKIIEQDEKERLRGQLNRLTDEQKQVIILKFIEGMDNKRISEITGKNEEAIRALQYRALKELKKALT